jgi:ribonuclease BN (tRNA processing enzyme)
MNFKRLSIAMFAAASLIGAGPPAPRVPQRPASGVSLTLLGTAGGPGARVDRAGIATLLQVNGKSYLIDAGEGVARQLVRAGLRETDIPLVFLTHLHDDHTAGLGALATFAFTLRSPGMEVVGPLGTADLVTALVGVLNVNAEIRMNQGRFPAPPSAFLKAREYQAGVVYDDGQVRVTAIENTHYDFPPNSPAARDRSYALRFAAGGKVIVFTGDTGPSPEVEKLAEGADILVSEMASAADRRSVPPFVLRHMEREHLSPTEVGKLATRAHVKMLVLSHIGIVERSDLAELRRAFAGPIVVGADLKRL